MGKMKFIPLCVSLLSAANIMAAGDVGQWEVFETSFETGRQYTNAFMDVEVNVVFSQGDKQWVVPAFWAGGSKWTVRFAPPVQGAYKFHVKCTDAANADLNGHEQALRVAAYTGDNPLLKHGFLRVSTDKRHFEQADGTPFFWLGDTWWKGLCQRLTWEGFQELTADRKAKALPWCRSCAGRIPMKGCSKPAGRMKAASRIQPGISAWSIRSTLSTRTGASSIWSPTGLSRRSSAGGGVAIATACRPECPA